MHGTPILEDYSETFDARMVRVLVTSLSRKWALEAATETKGIGRSATQPPCEATIECEVSPDDTPDGRHGVVIQMMDRKAEKLRDCLALRLRKGAVPQPRVAIFDWLPEELREDRISLADTVIPKFGDGFESVETNWNRRMIRIPRMDGWLWVEQEFGIRTACTGGMFLILGRSVDAALAAAEEALRAAGAVDRIVVKCAASGSKVGSRTYEDMVATTNDAYCPGLRNQTETRLPPEVECVYEIIVSGPTEADVRAGMRAGIYAASGCNDIVAIHTANYGGKLGSGRIELHSLFP